MQIIFQGMQTAEEAAESLLSIIKLFKERYGICNYREMDLNVTLLDQDGEDVELIDSATSEVLGVFEVYKSTDAVNDAKKEEKPKIHLVVDNTK